MKERYTDNEERKEETWKRKTIKEEKCLKNKSVKF